MIVVSTYYDRGGGVDDAIMMARSIWSVAIFGPGEAGPIRKVVGAISTVAILAQGTDRAEAFRLPFFFLIIFRKIKILPPQSENFYGWSPEIERTAKIESRNDFYNTEKLTFLKKCLIGWIFRSELRVATHMTLYRTENIKSIC